MSLDSIHQEPLANNREYHALLVSREAPLLGQLGICLSHVAGRPNDATESDYRRLGRCLAWHRGLVGRTSCPSDRDYLQSRRG